MCQMILLKPILHQIFRNVTGFLNDLTVKINSYLGSFIKRSDTQLSFLNTVELVFISFLSLFADICNRL
jgi:hypothetical protein